MVHDEDGRNSVSIVSPGQLPYPSLNEVNFLAFTEVTEEYHNELYGFIEAEELIERYKSGKPTIPYVKIQRNRNRQQISIILTEYIRRQIHHPENRENDRFSVDQLKESIKLMRCFIMTQNLGRGHF